MINVQPKLSFKVSANAAKQETPKPAGSFSKDMKDAITRSTQEAPKSTIAAKIKSEQISDSQEDTDVLVSDIEENELNEETNEITVTGENVLPLVELPIVQADIELSNEDVKDEQVVETQSKTLAFVPRHMIKQSEQEAVADHTVATDELSMEQQNTIEGVLEDIEHSIKNNTQGKENTEVNETENAQTENPEVKVDANNEITDTVHQENEDEDNNDVNAEFKKAPYEVYEKQQTFAVQPDLTPRKIEMEFNPKMQSAKESVEFSMKFLEEVRTTITEGKSELFIQLKPEYLGGLAVKLSMTDEGLTAKLITSNKEVHAAMNNQLFIVQDVLKSKNIDVVSMEVIYEQSASFDTNLNDGSRNSYFQNFNSNFQGNNTEEAIAINTAYNSLLQLDDTDAETVEFMA